VEAEDVRCPVCSGRGSDRAWVPELADAEKRGEVVIGGCLASDDNASCLQCGETW
jgi:hypothetical protein